jgi:hypothetical protein
MFLTVYNHQLALGEITSQMENKVMSQGHLYLNSTISKAPFEFNSNSSTATDTQKNRSLWSGSVAQLVDHLPSKHEAQSSNPSPHLNVPTQMTRMPVFCENSWKDRAASF